MDSYVKQDCTNAYLLMNRIEDGTLNMIQSFEKCIIAVSNETFGRFDTSVMKVFLSVILVQSTVCNISVPIV